LQKRQIISFIVAVIGTTAAICLESVVTPGTWEEKWHLVGAIAALNIIRLYAFYEGAVMREISIEKAKLAFKLSISLTCGFAAYGIYLKAVEPSFGWHSLGLFLLLQFGLAVVEWMFSERMSNYVDTEFGKQMTEIKEQFTKQLKEAATLLKNVREQLAKQLADLKKQSAENEKLLQKQLSELQAQFSEQSKEKEQLLIENEEQKGKLSTQKQEQQLSSKIVQLAGQLMPATQSHKLALCTNCCYPNHIHNSKLAKHTGNDPEAVICNDCSKPFMVTTQELKIAS